MAKRCLFCYEKVHRLAKVCPHCHREINKAKGNPGKQEEGVGLCSSIAMGLMGIATGALAVILVGFLRERQKWESDDVIYPDG